MQDRALAASGREPTPTMVRGLYRHLTSAFGTTPIERPTSLQRAVLARARELLGAVSVRAALELETSDGIEPATMGRHLFLPFEIGAETARWSLWRQMLAAVHAHQRVAQLEEHGALVLALRKLGSARALLEVEALRACLELTFWRFGDLPPVEGMAFRLLGRVMANDIAIARAQHDLDRAAAVIRAGVITTDAAACAVEWLSEHAPRLALPVPSA